MKALKSQREVHVIHLTICAAFILFAAACTHTLPEYAAQPPAPAQHKTPPSAAPLPESISPDSIIPVTLTGELTPIQGVIKKAIPPQFDEKDHPLGVDFQWRFVPDGDPQVSIEGGRVSIHAAYKGEIEGKTSARGCRLDPVYPLLEGTADISLRQDGESIAVAIVNPQIKVDLKPESDSKCNMFNVPLKDQLPEILNREGLRQQIIKSVDQAGFKILIQPVWAGLQGPIAVPIVPMNTQLCIYGKPSQMTVGKIEGSQQQGVLLVTAKMHPTTSYQDVCRNATASPPQVTLGQTVPGEQTLKLLAKIPVPYTSLTTSLQEKLFHSEVSLGRLFGDKLVVEKASAADANGKVLIAIQTSGDVIGTIYYSGTPQLEAGGALLIVGNLQMDTESKKILDSVKIGYWQQVDTELKPKVQAAAKIDLSQHLIAMRGAMTGKHKTGDLTTEVTVVRQQAQRAYSTRDSLVAEVLFEGTARATGRFSVHRGTVPPVSSDHSLKPGASSVSH
jgi:hypothetical protein